MTPSTAVACHLLVRARHRVAQAQHGLSVAQAVVAEAGLTVEALDRALALLEAGPNVLEQQQRMTARILTALSAPGLEIETVEVAERRGDEPLTCRAERIRRRGWIAAVLNRAVDPPANADEATIWLGGFNAFRAELRAYENRQTRKPRISSSVAA